MCKPKRANTRKNNNRRVHFLKQNQTPCSPLMEKALFFANWAHQSQSTTHTWNFQFLPVELLGEVATRHVYGQMEAGVVPRGYSVLAVRWLENLTTCAMRFGKWLLSLKLLFPILHFEIHALTGAF